MYGAAPAVVVCEGGLRTLTPARALHATFSIILQSGYYYFHIIKPRLLGTWVVLSARVSGS